jgi:hypothetical protein
MRDVFFSIGDPGRAALELPDGAPGTRSGPADIEMSAAALPGMVIRAAATRGLLHRARGTPRQDAFALGQCSIAGEISRAVGVVCDGVGQFGRSDEAAVLVSRRLADLSAGAVPWPDAFVRVNEELRKVAEGALASETADPDGDGMATTALGIAVHREVDEWVGAAAWVGDSTLWHLSSDNEWALVTVSPDDEIEAEYHSTGVTPLPSADGTCSSCEFRIGGGALFVMSDGVANPLKWSRDVQEALAGWWMRPPDPITFAAQVGFARKSHLDDRSAIGIWPDGSDADEGQES